MATYRFEFNNALSSTDLFPLGVPVEPELHYFVEMTVYDPGIGGTKVLRYCTGRGYETGGNYYEPRVKSAGNLKISLYQSGKTSGASQVGYGEVVLSNADGGLDAIVGYGFDGRSIVIKKALVVGAVVGALTTILSCSMEQPETTWSEVSIRTRDNQDRLNVPVQAEKYAGTNSLPNGVEGTDDIKGKPKPLLFGVCKNVTPVCVNTSKLIYQVRAGALQSVSGVYDKGVGLKAGLVYSSQADMEANAPAPGEYRVWLQGGCIRLGAAPAGQLTMDATEGALAADRSAAALFSRIADLAPTIDAAADIDAADLAALHTANPAEVGIYLTQETTVAAALDEVLRSIGGWYTFDSTGKVRLGRLEAPTGSPALTITDSDKISIERIPSNDEGRGLPAWKVNLGYDKNWTVQTDVAGSLSVANLLWEQRTLPVVANWSGVAYGNGVFVAIASGSGTAAISRDAGNSWTLVNMPSNAAWADVAFGNGMFVAVATGTGSTVAATSPDGVTWTARTISAGNWTAVTYGNGRFVATSAGSVAAVSTDNGATWSPYTMPTGNWYAVAYGNNTFVAVAMASGLAATSADGGVTWVQRSMPNATSWHAIAFNEGRFVAASTNQYSATSEDGITWVLKGGRVQASKMAFGLERFITVGRYPWSTTAIPYGFSSENADVWNTMLMPSSMAWSGIAYGDGAFVAVAYNSSVSALLTGAAPLYRRQWLSKESRTVSAEDATVKVKHLMARELNINTSIVSAADAQTEATRLLNLYQVDRDRLRVNVPSSIVPADALGKVISLKVPRYGYDAGKLMQVIGQEIDYSTNRAVLDVWG